MSICYLNGKFIPLEDATISVLDRGFLFSDAIYDVVPIYNQNPFHMNKHLKRLQRSLTALKINTNCVRDAASICQQLIDKNSKYPESYIYIHVSRGAAETRRHQSTSPLNPTVFASLFPCARKRHQSVSVMTHEEIRWGNCWIKSTSLLGNVMGMNTAEEHNAQECIFHKNNFLTEGGSSNIFIIENDTLYTPPLSPQILEGITRSLILELCHIENIKCIEEPISMERFLNANATFISSSTRAIAPIHAINEQQRDPKNPLILILQKAYDAAINNHTMCH